MGLAVGIVVLYHAPFVLHDPWVSLVHSCLNCGVDMFLFLSGIGAVHSLSARGPGDYLRRRAARLLPGLYLFLIPWCGLMTAQGLMNRRELLGSLTLLGWWLGNSVQLNWYFSAVWMFFLLAIAVYRLHGRTGRPWLTWAGLILLAVAVGYLCPRDYLMTALARLPVFFTGMLFGVLEQRGFRHTAALKTVCYLLIPLGLWCWMVTDWGYGDLYGYRFGTWWYPYALFTPGLALGISGIGDRLASFRWFRWLKWPLDRCGESSAEILMVHVGLYKILQDGSRYRNRVWVMIALGCLVLGCLYRLLTERMFQKLT